MKKTVRYDKNGCAICEICGLAFNALMQHIRMTHDITEWQYLEMHGLDFHTQIISQNKFKKLLKK